MADVRCHLHIQRRVVMRHDAKHRRKHDKIRKRHARQKQGIAAPDQRRNPLSLMPVQAGATKAHSWYSTNGSAITSASSSVTLTGTKNEPVTSVTIILPSFGKFISSGRASQRKISAAHPTKPRNTSATASKARITRRRSSTR